MTTCRTLSQGQSAQVWVGGPERAGGELVFETTDLLIEAPNWSLDGRSLFVNGHGRLWRLDLDGPSAGLVEIEYDALPDLNNDHVLDPDGEHIHLSAMDGHIYRGAVSGGPVERVSPDDGVWHFLHGVSPDGSRLAYVELAAFDQPGRLAVLPLGGEPVRVDTGRGHLDGPEWSPDGQWIYVNTETFTTEPGHAQLARISWPGNEVERVLESATVDWFPHLSPDGRYASYVAFPSGTLGHPADLEVEVRVVSVTDWTTPLQRYRLSGGQGTLNVNSWAPDSQRFAYVAYPLAQ